MQYFSMPFAGREIFVGLSSRTNMLGAQAVAKAFPEYPTNIVKVHEPAVHLRDNISMAGPEVMAVAKTASAQKTFQVGIPTPCPDQQ
jgi:dimethylargininase